MRKVGGLILPDVEYLNGFIRYDTADDSTIHCPCGSSFTWEGYSQELGPWMDAHREHQKKD